MQPILPTIVLRHRKENLKKCSLRGLESRNDFQFFSYPCQQLPDLSRYILLTLEAPPLTEQDRHLESGLFLVDATWRYAAMMLQKMPPMLKRSLPANFRTAYPRRQLDCPNPECGLSSIEALYIAFHILGKDTSHLLDNYYWKNQFLELNSSLF